MVRRVPAHSTLIIHVIRTNKIPFLQSRASWPVFGMRLLMMAVGAGLSFLRAGHYIGFTRLPVRYWPLLALALVCYLALTQAVKMLLLRRRWI